MSPSDPILSSRILVVDDENANVVLLSRVLQSAGYHDITGLVDPVQAIAFCRRTPPDLILLDLHMPIMDGFEALTRFKAEISEDDQPPIVMVTWDTSAPIKRRALALGATEILAKPADPSEVLIRVRNLLELKHLHRQMRTANQALEEKVRVRTRDLEHAQMESLQLLARAAEFRDDDTEEHTRRVGSTAAKIAEAIGDKGLEPDAVGLAAGLHDIGKIGLPDSILLKPGPLTKDEYELMKSHTEMGAAIIGKSKSPVLIMAKEIALSHHEWVDGTGYPRGLSGDQIPLLGRIVAVADVYDALTHVRPYKEAWPVDKARTYILEQAGKQFDKDVAELFLNLL